MTAVEDAPPNEMEVERMEPDHSVTRLLPVLVAPCLLVAQPAAAQDDHALETDRPDFTEGTAPAGAGHVQVEAGYTFARAPGDATEHTLGELLIRVGAGDHVEIRVGLDSYTWSRGPAGGVSGLTDTSLGLKWRLAQGEAGSARPSVALLAATTLPTGADLIGEAGSQPEAKLALAWEPSDRVGIGSNLNYVYVDDGGVRFHRFAATLAFAFSLTDRVGTYLEAYGFAPADDDHPDFAYANGGFTYLLSPAFQLDARAGIRWDDADDHFVGVGLAYRW